MIRSVSGNCRDPGSTFPRFDVAGAAIAYVVYVGGSLAALLSRYRGLRASEAVGLVALPFLFNLVMVLGADWHMQELGALLSPDVPHEFQAQVFVAAWRSCSPSAKRCLLGFSTIGTGRPTTNLRLHALMLVGGALAALSPLTANLAQSRHGAVSRHRRQHDSRRARAGRPVDDRLCDDRLGAGSPRGQAARRFTPPTIMRAPDSSKARYTAPSSCFCYWSFALPLRDPAFVAFVRTYALPLSPLLGLLPIR